MRDRTRIPNSKFLILNCTVLFALLGARSAFPQGDSLTREGGVAFINPGSPTAEAAGRAVPRLPDLQAPAAQPRTGTGDLFEFICHENNQYGSAGRFRPGTGGAR